MTKSQYKVTLCQTVRLDITIIVLACPDEASLGFQHVGNHVVDETMLVMESLLVVLLLVVLLEDLLEYVLEKTIILLHNGVLGAEVQWEPDVIGELEAWMCELSDRLIMFVPFVSEKGFKVYYVTSTVLYIPMPHPPSFSKWNTSCFSTADPSSGVNTISNLPDFRVTKSLARYWSP